jgi:hypothetical protein
MAVWRRFEGIVPDSFPEVSISVVFGFVTLPPKSSLGSYRSPWQVEHRLIAMCQEWPFAP